MMSIQIVNAVRFWGGVKDPPPRRAQWAVNNRARQMTKQMDDCAVKRVAEKTGLS